MRNPIKDLLEGVEGTRKAERRAFRPRATPPAPGSHGRREEPPRAPSAGPVLRLHPVGVSQPGEIESAFSAIARGHADALYLVADAMLGVEQKRIIALSAKGRLPTMYPWRTAVEAGGLMSYQVDWSGSSRPAASYVDKILKGAKPGDLPVEQRPRTASDPAMLPPECPLWPVPLSTEPSSLGLFWIDEKAKLVSLPRRHSRQSPRRSGAFSTIEPLDDFHVIEPSPSGDSVTTELLLSTACSDPPAILTSKTPPALPAER